MENRDDSDRLTFFIRSKLGRDLAIASVIDFGFLGLVFSALGKLCLDPMVVC